MASDWIDKQFVLLKELAEERFSQLSGAESKMLRASISGDVAFCGPSEKDADPHNNPHIQEEWDQEREIRAELLRWLCVDKTAECRVDPRGIKLHSAKISGKLNLSAASVRFPLMVRRCRFAGDILLLSTGLASLDLKGSSTKKITADGVIVKGNVVLSDGFSASGTVSLLGAQIHGALDCTGGTFTNPAREGVNESGTALDAGRASVNGTVFLNRGFKSQGKVTLQGCQIDGNVECDGGIFKNPPEKDVQASGMALNMAHVRVSRSVFLRNGLQAEGETSLFGAQIGRDLVCQNGSFKNPAQTGMPSSGIALLSAHAEVKGNVFLNDGFVADGQVNLRGAQIGADLACQGGIFKNPTLPGVPSGGIALAIYDATVMGNVRFTNGFTAVGQAGLSGMQIVGDFDAAGGSFGEVNAQRMTILRALFWRGIKNPENVMLDLKDASVGSIVDDRASWPAAGRLSLDGFIYGRIATGPKDSKSRLKWLGLQQSFSSQPYRQLAKVLREEGDDAGARDVLYEMERRKRQDGKLVWHTRLWHTVFRLAIGYGVYPRRAFVVAAAARCSRLGLVFPCLLCRSDHAHQQRGLYRIPR